jgi:hypothetical protein
MRDNTFIPEDISATMFGYSKVKNEVFILPKEFCEAVTAKIELNTDILALNKLTAEHWKKLEAFQGRWTVFYLKLRYCSADSRVLLAFAGENLVHIEWIVPSKNMKSRYSFLPEDSYSIISCLTSSKFRGLGIYPSQLRKAAESNLPAKMFYIWAAADNNASLNGILKAGGVKIGELVQKKWLWGCFSHIKYFSATNNIR